MLGEKRRTAVGTKSKEALPKMGAVCPQWVRCGRAGCRCNSGELHGPYYYLFWREGRRLRKRYVPRAQAPAVQVACMERRERERITRWEKQIAWRRWQLLQRTFKELVDND